MPLFKIGDYVERVDSLVPPYMKFGCIVGVIPNPNGPEHLTEYEVEFTSMRATLYQIQLRLVEDPLSRSSTA
jgi:hypothetical protein